MIPFDPFPGTFLWQSSLLLAGVFLVNTLFLRKCPAHRYTLLLVTLVCLPPLLLGPHIPIPASPPTVPESAPEKVVEPTMLHDLGRLGWEVNRPGAWLDDGMGGALAGEDGFDTGPWIIAVWLVGTVLLLVRHLVGLIRLRRCTARSRPAGEGDMLRRFHRIRDALRASPRIRLLLSPDLDGPAAAGALCPSVFIPSEMAAASRPGLDETLAHEILHLKRRDPLHQHLVGFVRALFWFHPLVHLAVRRLDIERERAVDLAVLEATGNTDAYLDELKDRARALAARSAPAMRATAFLGMRRSVIRRRIEMLLSHTSFRTARRPGIFFAGAGLALGLALVFLVLGACAGGPDAAPDENVGMEQPDFRTRVVGTDTLGDYRLYQGMERVVRVELMPKEYMTDDPPEELLVTLDETCWTFLPETQALRLKEPVDLRVSEIRVHGEQAFPFVWQIGNWTTHEICPIEKGTVGLAFDGRDAIEGEDYEVDYEAGIIRCLDEERCATEKVTFTSWAIRPYKDNPDIMMGVAGTAGGKHGRPKPDDEEESSHDRLEKALRSLPVERQAHTGIWKTDTANTFVPKQPLSESLVYLRIQAKNDRNRVKLLEKDKDFAFDPETQRITLHDPGVFDPETEFLFVRGCLDDPRAYQFPGSIPEGSVEFVYGGQVLEEGKDFVVDYARGRVTLTELDIVSCTVTGKGSYFATVVHTLKAGPWKIAR